MAWLWSRRLRHIPLWLALMAGFLGASVLPASVALLRARMRNESLILNAAEQQMERSLDGIEVAAQQLIDQYRPLELIAAFAAESAGLMRGEKGIDILWKSLDRAPSIDAVYLSLEDGFHRVVTRMDEGRRRSARVAIPSSARWHSSLVDASLPPERRVRVRRFYSDWRRLVAPLLHEPSRFDPRALPHYREAKKTGRVVISGVQRNPDTGLPVVSVAVPIQRQSQFLGIVAANITADGFSRFLASQISGGRASVFLLDHQGGVVASSGGISRGDLRGDLAVRELLGRLATQPRAVYRQPSQQFGNVLVATRSFSVGAQGGDWQLVYVVPESDVVGALRLNAWRTTIDLTGVALIGLVLLLLFSRRVTRSLEDVAARFQAVGRLDFGASVLGRMSRLQEVSRVQEGLDLLAHSLQSFSRFVPLALVRRLAAGHQRELHRAVEARELTILFCDLEGFTAFSETASSQELLAVLNRYFAMVCDAILEQGGTIDKFIGDAVMAFWGAPDAVDDAAYRACVAALQIQASLRSWAKDNPAGPSLLPRLGIHAAVVSVGTMGTPDRWTYTAVGDGVNVAARLEALNKTWGTQICVSEAVVQRCGQRLRVRSLGTCVLRGRQGSLQAYELCGLEGSALANG